MIKYISDITGIVTVFFLLLFSFFLITQKKGKRISHFLLAGFLFSNALYICNFLLWRYSTFFIPDFPHLFYIGFAFGYLFGPLLYLYTKSRVFSNFKLKKSDILHFLPFILIAFLTLYFYQFRSIEVKMQVLIRGYLFGNELDLINYAFLQIIIMSYMFATIILLGKYSAEIKKFYSSLEKLNLTWLNIIVFGFLIMWLVDIVEFMLLLTELSTPLLISLLTLLSLLINFVFANLIIYEGLKYPQIITGIEDIGEKPKYETSTLRKEDSAVYLDKLISETKNEKYFLDPNLTLKQLSDSTGIPSRHLSQVINESMQKNFFDFVNSFRIEEAKNRLINPIDTQITVLEILYEVGFNSKSAFNAAFKKYTGLTPTEFKRRKDVKQRV